MRKSLICLRLTVIGLVLGAVNVTVLWAGDSDPDPRSLARPFQIGEQFTYDPLDEHQGWITCGGSRHGTAGLFASPVSQVKERAHQVVGSFVSEQRD